jgi:acetyl esterase/lipase/lysophospholipase L1-like esterase
LLFLSEVNYPSTNEIIMKYRTRIATAVLFIFISALSYLNLAGQVASSANELDLVFIGNSITQGVQLENPGESAPPAFAASYLGTKKGVESARFLNRGRSGYTTVNFLPSTDGELSKVVMAVKEFHTDLTRLLVFSISLGTNDSAEEGPKGSPVSPETYRQNMKAIIGQLLTDFPGCRVIIQQPIWYSTTTYNRSRYLAAGLARLESYFPELRALVQEFSRTNPQSVFMGDTQAFDYFRENHLTDLIPEPGNAGTFYLHPNKKGAEVLGKFWAEGIWQALYSNQADNPAGPSSFLNARYQDVITTDGVRFADVTDYKGKTIPLLLDIYQPSGDSSVARPVIIWIHGGGFRTGSLRTQNYIVKFCQDFARRGYVCLSVDYRLRDGADMPDKASEFPALKDAARDVNSALEWVRANYEVYKIDPNLIFLAGGSAGGRTSVTVCQFPGPDSSAQNPPDSKFRTIPWNKKGIIANACLWGGIEPEMRGWVYPYLNKNGVPTVLIHGDADVTIDVQNSIDLDKALVNAAVTSELHIIQGAAHTPTGEKTYPVIVDWVARFFVKEWEKSLSDPRL